VAPLACAGMSLCAFDLVLGQSGTVLPGVAALLAPGPGWRLLADLVGMSACGGVFSVPLYALVQARAAPAWRGRSIAAGNVVNAAGMVAASGLAAAAAALGAGAGAIVLGAALLNLAVAAWIWRRPAFGAFTDG
jgi:hypothetical protein